MDIDDFKDLNDQYGHLVGDEVIKSVSRLLESEKYEGEFVARQGGDEFVALLPRATKEGIDKKALISSADDQLYLSKANGKNRTS